MNTKSKSVLLVIACKQKITNGVRESALLWLWLCISQNGLCIGLILMHCVPPLLIKIQVASCIWTLGFELRLVFIFYSASKFSYVLSNDKKIMHINAPLQNNITQAGIKWQWESNVMIKQVIFFYYIVHSNVMRKQCNLNKQYDFVDNIMI